MKRKHPKELTVHPRSKTQTIYCDMDGVIANFFEELAKWYEVRHWKDIPQKKNDTFSKIAGTDFFYHIPKFSTSDELIAFLDDMTEGSWVILSSPLRGDRINSAYHKHRWLEKQGYKPADEIFTSVKETYAVTVDGFPNILIDDRPENISRWRAKGGIGIRYQADEDDLSQLLDKIKKALIYGEKE